MNQVLLIAPIVVPLAAAGTSAWARDHRMVQRAATGVALTTIVVAGFLLTQRALGGQVVHTVLGAEEAVTGIALTADPLGAALVAATGLLAALVVLTFILNGRDDHRFVHPLMMVLLAGTCGSFITGDLFNLFVFFEVVLIASYVLLILRGRPVQMRAAAVYVSLNLVGTLLLLGGIAAVFASTGTVNFAVLARTDVIAEGGLTGAALVVIAFAVKAGLLPFSGWLVVGYPAPQRAIMALFAGTMTTVGIAAMYRVVLLAFDGAAVLRTSVLIAAVASVLVTSVAAIAATDHGRVFALLVATQVGFMAIGFGLGTRAAVAAGVFFVLQDVIVKTAALLAHRQLLALDTSTGKRMAKASFGVLGLSLVGIPPLSGFVGKALLVEAAFATAAPFVAVAVLAGSGLTLAALLPLWNEATDAQAQQGTREDRRGAAVPVAAAALAAIMVGVAPGGLLTLAETAADVLLDPSSYATQVLGS